MPPITVVAYEPDGDGGWLVHWHDDANLDGQPVDAFIHLQVEPVGDLVKVRQQTASPLTPMENAAVVIAEDRAKMRQSPAHGNPAQQKNVLGIPADVTPFAVRDFIDGYGIHVADCIDRYRLDVHGAAPHPVLEAARLGVPVPARWRRRPSSGPLDEFIARRSA